MGRLRDAAGRIALDAAERLFKAAAGQQYAPPPDVVANRPMAANAQTDKKGAPRSVFYDPDLSYGANGESLDNHITARDFYRQMKQAVKALPLLQLIIKTRVEQVCLFAHPAKTRYDLGFRFTNRDTSQKPTPEDKQAHDALTARIQHCGDPNLGNPLRPRFPAYLSMLMRDSMQYGCDATELGLDRAWRPCQWWAIDASTIRHSSRVSPVFSSDLKDEIRFLQEVKGQVVTRYRWCDIMYGIRTPTTDLSYAGYAVSEVEMAMRAISAMLNAWDWNARMFAQGTNAKGILNMPGGTEPMVRDFFSMWRQAIAGVSNAHRMPVTTLDKLEFINLGASQKDIEWQEYFNMLVKTVCGIFSLDPEDINFKFGNVGQQAVMQNQDGNRQRIREGSEKGLRPTLQHFEQQIQSRLIDPITDKYKFEFVGLDAESRSEALEFNTKRVANTHTVDEIRAYDDLPPLPDGAGAVILNPTWLQNKQAMMQSDQQAAMNGQPEEDFGEEAPQQEQEEDAGSTPTDIDVEMPDASDFEKLEKAHGRAAERGWWL